MPRHALRSELAAVLDDGWVGAPGRHALDSDMPEPLGVTGRHALAAEVEAIVVGPSAPEFVTAQGGKGFSATTNVPALTGTQAGDVLLAFAAGNDQTATLTPPGGLTWTSIADTGVAAVRGRLLVATATGAVGADTWTWGGSHNHAVSIGAWRNVDAPTAGAASAVTAAGQTTVNAPTRTTVASDALLICFGFHTASGDTSRGFPGTMTVRRDGGNGAASSVLAEEARPTPGATGTRAYTIAPGGAVLFALSVALEPAA